MTRRWVQTAAWAIPGLTLVIWVLAFTLGPSAGGPLAMRVIWAAPFMAFSVVGALIIHYQPANRVGWMLSGVGLLMGCGLVYVGVVLQLSTSPAWRGLAPWLLLAGSPIRLAVWALVVLVLLLFPNGRLPSPRWRWLVVFLCVFLGAVEADTAVSQAPPMLAGLPSPLANPELARLLDSVTSYDLNGVVLLFAAASLVFRYRAGSLAMRQQIKWLAFSAGVLAAFAIAGGLVNAFAHLNDLQTILQSAGLLAVAAAIGLAVIRYRLYDVDLIISRALAYGGLALLATVLYVGLVVGVGSLVGRTSRADLLLSIVATAVVAVAFHPIRLRLQEAANRLVYGRRETPYELLAGFTRRLADGNSVNDTLPRMAEALANGLRGRAAAVYLHEAWRQPALASWPDASHLPDTSPDHSVEVWHQGERLGSLAVWTKGGTTLNATEGRLLGDLAVQAGMVLRNARLAIELERRLEDLRASRRRLVAAQDAERRRLERDLHDGAQHDLVAVRMKLGLAEKEAAASGSHLTAYLGEVREETAAALENIRRLSRGLYPPLLESQGLAAAVNAHARRLPIPVDVRADGGRFSREMETAIYFCCVEALQNASKHACASRAWISIERFDGQVGFEVGDDGHGFDPANTRAGSGLQNISDRIEALGGSVRIHSGRNGTRIEGRLPAEPERQAAQKAGSRIASG